MKAKEILEEAKKNGITLEFDVDITNNQPTSYKDLIINKNELQYINKEVKDLEKKYYDLREKSTLQNLDMYKDHKEEINGINTIIMTVPNKDNNLLKSIADSLVNEDKNLFVFFANIKEDKSVNYICKTNTKMNAGMIVKMAANASDGNGGGSQTFAQGGGKTSHNLDDILKEIKKAIASYE